MGSAVSINLDLSKVTSMWEKLKGSPLGLARIEIDWDWPDEIFRVEGLNDKFTLAALNLRSPVPRRTRNSEKIKIESKRTGKKSLLLNFGGFVSMNNYNEYISGYSNNLVINKS